MDVRLLSPQEEIIGQQLNAEIPPAAATRNRAKNLARDIAQLTAEKHQPDPCSQLRQIDTGGRALGALYLVEGSTRGGPIIANMISRHLGRKQGLSFFTGYGLRTAALLKSFKDVLDQPLPAAQRQQIVAMAQDTLLRSKIRSKNMSFNPNYDSELCGRLPIHLINTVQP